MSIEFGRGSALNRERKIEPVGRAVRSCIAAVFALTIFISIAFSPCRAEEGWNKLSPEAGVNLEIPGDVKPIRKGKVVERYESTYENYFYIVTTEPSSSGATLDEILVSFRKELAKGDLTKSGPEADASGKAWDGKRFLMSTEKGDASMSILVARDTDSQVLTCLSTSAPMESPQTKRFFDSLQMDPEAIGAHKKEVADKFFKRLMSPSSMTDWCGIFISLFGVLAAVFGWLFLVITAFRTSIIWGLLVSFTGGFGIMLFLIFNPRRAFPAFLLQLFGIIVIGVGAAILLPNLTGISDESAQSSDVSK